MQMKIPETGQFRVFLTVWETNQRLLNFNSLVLALPNIR